MDQGTFYFSQTAMSQPDLTNGALLSFTAAAQQTKKSITNSFISRKPIEFYVKSIFQNKNIMDEYNFYKETNINKIKLFLENFLNELSKPPSFNSRESFAFHPERINTYGSNYKSTESKGVSIEMVNEQVNELKSCLKHFTKSLSEINHAELEYMESIEKANLSRFTQKYKVNKQVLFQESENLIVFTNNLIQYLEMLNLNVNEEAVKIVAPENTTAFSVTDLETKEDVKVQDKMTQTVPSPKQKAEKSIISKDTSRVTTPKKMSSEMVSLAEESLYSTGVHKTANFPTVSREKSMEASQVSSVQKEVHEQHEEQENFSLNDVQNVQSRVTEDNTEDKIAQLLQLNKMLGTELQMKDDALRHTKTIFLKEVQDSNNLRVQLTNMIEDNIELKQKLEEAITLNDEFERTLVEKDQQLQENLNYTEHELAKIEAFYEERIEALTRRILELDDEIKILRRQNLELKTMNIEFSRHRTEGGFQISEAESGEQG